MQSHEAGRVPPIGLWERDREAKLFANNRLLSYPNRMLSAVIFDPVDSTSGSGPVSALESKYSADSSGKLIKPIGMVPLMKLFMTQKKFSFGLEE